MSGVNLVIIAGRLGKDPELRYTKEGTAVCGLTVATSESYVDKASGERKEVTEWHKVTAWGKQAETAAKYLKKGSWLHVRGHNRTHKYDKDGQTHYATEVVCDRLDFIGPKMAESPAPEAPVRTNEYAKASGASGTERQPEDFDDSIPF